MRLLLFSSSVNANLFFHLEVREEMGKKYEKFSAKKGEVFAVQFLKRMQR